MNARKPIFNTFGRLIEFDPRSREYPIQALLAANAPRVTKLWTCAVNLDQGREGACTGFAVSGEAAADPYPVAGITNAVALALYHEAQKLDPWAGTPHDGSTVLAAMKAGKARKWYGVYRWAFGEEDLALAVGNAGPAVLGINWYSGMREPDCHGLIRRTGSKVGGHAILCRGYDVPTGRYLLRNSWGPRWGLAGDCWISAEDMARLLSERGEACIPIVRKLG